MLLKLPHYFSSYLKILSIMYQHVSNLSRNVRESGVGILN